MAHGHAGSVLESGSEFSASSSSNDSDADSESPPPTRRQPVKKNAKKKRVRERSPRRGHGRDKRRKQKHHGRSPHVATSRRERHMVSSEAPQLEADSSRSEASVSVETAAPPADVVSDVNDGGDIVALDDVVHVSELGVTVFESCDALDRYLKAYSRRTFQIYSVRTNTPVHKRNARMVSNRSMTRRIPEELKFYNRTYVCTHYGAPRESTGRGTRPNQCSRRIGCEAQINACVREAGDWEVAITKQNTAHNHEVSEVAYQTYHEAREVSGDEVLATVQTIHRAGANRKRILEYISENTTVDPIMKDAHNLVARLKGESYAFPTIEERIRAILEDFASQKGNLTQVYANEDVKHKCGALNFIVD